MDQIRILLLGAGNRVSLCEWLLESGKKYNTEIKLCSIEIKNPVPISEYATIILGEKASSPTFERSIIDTINQYKINIVLPLMDSLCTSLSKYKENIEKQTGAWLVVSSYDICNTMEDKVLSEKWFIDHGVKVPFGPDFPRIFKSRRGYGSRDMFRCNSEKDLKLYRELKGSLDGYFDQPIIEGPEYTVDAYVCKQGYMVGAVSRERLTVVNGEVNTGITKRQPELLEEVRRILSFPGFVGPITLQFIKCKTSGHWYCIEINPRAGGGLIQSLRAGANYCECLLAEHLEVPLPDCSNWKENLLMMRANREFWAEDFKG